MVSYAITRDGVRIAYESVGHGKPLLLVHGLGDDRSIWNGIVHMLAPRYTCVTLDLRGHGQTTGGRDFDPFGLWRDIDAVVTDAGLREPALIGHSLGAFVATLFAARQRERVRAVVNVDQSLALDAFAPAVRAHEAALRAGKVKEVFFDLLGATGLGPVSRALRERLERSRERLPAEVILGIWGPLFGTKERLDAQVERALAQVAAPYLCIFGQAAPAEYVAWLKRHLAQAEVESWTGLGHFLHLLEPERFCERVRQFIC